MTIMAFSAKPEGCPSDLPPSPAILTPCAACKILRRRCAEKCVLAPYFPPTQPLKFTIAHRVFGASNIIKLLQELPESQRADAVNSMVYEANARLRDPIYGCAGAICHLQNKINDLQAELAKAQAEIMNVQCQNANLCDLIYKVEIMRPNASSSVEEHNNNNTNLETATVATTYDQSSTFLEDAAVAANWELLGSPFGHNLR